MDMFLGEQVPQPFRLYLLVRLTPLPHPRQASPLILKQHTTTANASASYPNVCRVGNDSGTVSRAPGTPAPATG